MSRSLFLCGVAAVLSFAIGSSADAGFGHLRRHAEPGCAAEPACCAEEVGCTQFEPTCCAAEPLARKPVSREIKTANAIMIARKGDAVGALQDIWWAVLNSNEFIINH